MKLNLKQNTTRKESEEMTQMDTVQEEEKWRMKKGIIQSNKLKLNRNSEQKQKSLQQFISVHFTDRIFVITFINENRNTHATCNKRTQ